MNRAVVSVASVFLFAGPAFAGNEALRLDRFEVNADTIQVDENDVMHASGNVILTDEFTEIRADSATISVKDGKTIIDTSAVRDGTTK